MTNSLKIEGSVPRSGVAKFVVPNRLEYKDILALESVLGGRKVTYLILGTIPSNQMMKKFFAQDHIDGIVIDTSSLSPDVVGEMVNVKLREGKNVVYVPSDAVCHRGSLCTIPTPKLEYLSKMNVNMTPLFVAHYADLGMVTSSEEWHELRMEWGDEIEVTGIQALPCLWESWMKLSEAGMSKQPILQMSLAEAVVRGMKAHPHARLIDGIDDSSMPFTHLLGAGIAFAKHLKTLTSKKRVGIILPSGKGAVLANIACLLAGKIPVNINFTASQEGIASSIEQSEIDRYITADAFIRKFPDFPWPPTRDLILIDLERPKIMGSIKKWVVASKMMPVSALIALMKLNKLDVRTWREDDEATLLFTSGSSGLPKGVPLTHKNILANIIQCYSRIDLQEHARMLASLPLFHSFGCTITMWLPLVCGFDIVSYPSPKEAKRLGELIGQYNIQLVVTTPTFMRSMMKWVPVESLKNVKYLIAGAEKLSPDLATSFKNKFGYFPVEGYGLTECSPVCSVNMHTPIVPKGTTVLTSSQLGSVGQPIPGVAMCVKDPVTEEPLNVTDTGMIWVKGANVFSGYLNQDELNSQILKDGWFCTGDIGRIDTEGFIFIEGRLSRFSKIGGEMVPHEQLEISILRAYQLDPADLVRQIAVTGMPDKQKGEALVLLSTLPGSKSSHQDVTLLRYALMDMGVPPLWCPKAILHVDEIPVLPTGKLNIPKCQELVDNAVKERLI